MSYAHRNLCYYLLKPWFICLCTGILIISGCIILTVCLPAYHHYAFSRHHTKQITRQFQLLQNKATKNKRSITLHQINKILSRSVPESVSKFLLTSVDQYQLTLLLFNTQRCSDSTLSSLCIHIKLQGRFIKLLNWLQHLLRQRLSVDIKRIVFEKAPVKDINIELLLQVFY